MGGIERLQACAPPTRPNSGGQRGHTSSFATWPSPPVPAPVSKNKVLILMRLQIPDALTHTLQLELVTALLVREVLNNRQGDNMKDEVKLLAIVDC